MFSLFSLFSLIFLTQKANFKNRNPTDSKVMFLRTILKNSNQTCPLTLFSTNSLVCSPIVEKKIMEENGNFELGKIVSRAKSTACSKGEESSSLGCEILHTEYANKISCILIIHPNEL